MHFIHLFSILLPVCFNKFSVRLRRRVDEDDDDESTAANQRYIVGTGLAQGPKPEGLRILRDERKMDGGHWSVIRAHWLAVFVEDKPSENYQRVGENKGLKDVLLLFL